MILDTLFSLLQSASFGACAVSLDQRILLWNRAAERILGHSSREIVGRRCNDVMVGRGLTPECAVGCSSIRYVQVGPDPTPRHVFMMLCSSGERKWVSVAPAVISGALEGAPLLLYLFEDDEEVEASASTDDSVADAIAEGAAGVPFDHPQVLPMPGEASPLSRRELEVLRLVALGWKTTRIADPTRYQSVTRCATIFVICGTSSRRQPSSMPCSRACAWGIISVGGSPQ